MFSKEHTSACFQLDVGCCGPVLKCGTCFYSLSCRLISFLVNLQQCFHGSVLQLLTTALRGNLITEKFNADKYMYGEKASNIERLAVYETDNPAVAIDAEGTQHYIHDVTKQCNKQWQSTILSLTCRTCRPPATSAQAPALTRPAWRAPAHSRRARSCPGQSTSRTAASTPRPRPASPPRGRSAARSRTAARSPWP